MYPSQVIQIAFGVASLFASFVSPVVASPYSLPLPLAGRGTTASNAQPNTSLAYRQASVPALGLPVDVDSIARRDDGPAVCDLVAVLTLFQYRYRKIF